MHYVSPYASQLKGGEEEALSYWGLDIRYETIRRWSVKFAYLLVRQLKARKIKPKGKGIY